MTMPRPRQLERRWQYAGLTGLVGFLGLLFGCHPASDSANLQSYDLGVVFLDWSDRSTWTVSHEFSIVNSHWQTVEMEIVSVSCGCTEVELSKHVIPPNDTSPVRMSMQLRDRREQKREYAVVELRNPDGYRRQVQLELSCEVFPMIATTLVRNPTRIDLQDPWSPLLREFHVFAYVPDDLEGHLTVIPLDEDFCQLVNWTIQERPDNLGLGVHRHQARMTIDLKRAVQKDRSLTTGAIILFGTCEYRIAIEFVHHQPLKFEPRQLYLSHLDKSGVVTVRPNSPGVDIDRVSSSSSSLTVQCVDARADGTKHFLVERADSELAVTEGISLTFTLADGQDIPYPVFILGESLK